MRGGNRSKRVIIGGKEYKSIKEAGEAFAMTGNAVRYQIKRYGMFKKMPAKIID